MTPLVPAVATLQANLTLPSIDTQLVSMESDWRKMHTQPFPEAIRATFGQLRTAVEERDAGVVRNAVPLWKVEIAKEKHEDNEREKKRKEGITEKVLEDTTYGATNPFNWADEVETIINPTPASSITPIVKIPRDFSTLCSGVRNPWSSLNNRCRRSLPFKPRPHMNQPHPACFPVTNHHASTPLPVPVQTIETVRHPHGIAPSRPIIRTTSPVHHTSPTTTSVTHPTPLAHPVFVVQCQCGSTIPVHPIQYPFPASPHFDRRHHFGFRRPLQWRLRDYERGRSHLRGGQM
jgi:hypothetical protein